MDRRAIRKGKRPMVSSPCSSDEDDVPLVRRVPQPVGGITIRDRPAASAQPPSRESPVRADLPPPTRPTPPPVAGLDLAGPGGVASTITPEEIEDLRNRYKVFSFIRLSVPRPEDRVNFDLPGQVALYEFFMCELRLPFHPFFLNLLNRYRLVPAQLTTNSIRIICAFVILSFFQGSEARLFLFRAFYKLCHHSEDAWLVFTARPGQALPLRLPSKVRGWKSHFLYAHVEGVRADGREPNVSPNKNSAVDKRDRELFNRLTSSEIPSYKELLAEENL